MRTWLVTWNPKQWPWKTFDRDCDAARKKGYLEEGWNVCSKAVAPGDRLFLHRQGVEPRGIFASGYATSDPYRAKHFSDPMKTALYVDARWYPVLHPGREPILSRSRLLESDLRAVHWDTHKSGIRIDPAIAVALERVWADFLSPRGYSSCPPQTLADEVQYPEHFWEGGVRRIAVNAYERDPLARRACIDHYGTSCSVCGLSLERVYGNLATGFIHVHHLRPVASAGKRRTINPIVDLRPVCPNCHAIIHLHDPPISVEDLQTQIRHHRSKA